MQDDYNEPEETEEDTVVECDPDELEPRTLPEGRYNAILVQARKDTVPMESKFNPGAPQVKWRFRIDDPDAPEEFQGQMVFQNTLTAPRKGFTYLKFITSLGYTEKEQQKKVNLRELDEAEVMIQVKERMYKDDAGNTRTANNVADVWLRDA